MREAERERERERDKGRRAQRTVHTWTQSRWTESSGEQNCAREETNYKQKFRISAGKKVRKCVSLAHSLDCSSSLNSERLQNEKMR